MKRPGTSALLLAPAAAFGLLTATAEAAKNPRIVYSNNIIWGTALEVF